MGKDYSICVGAVGFGGGVWHSPDGGDNWNRIRDPFPLGSQVRGMAVYPDNPNRILAGSDHGIYRSEDSGATWEQLWSPMAGMPIWSIAIDPQDTDTIFVGIKPAALFRSKDGGESWSKTLRSDGPGVPHRPTHGHHADGRPAGPPHRLGRRRGGRRVPQPRRRGHLDTR